MTDTTDNTSRRPEPARAGALKSTLTVQLHTRYATLLWEGRPREKASARPHIVSMPQVIARAGKINADSGADNPYADSAMLALEQTIARGTTRLQEAVAELEKTLSGVPAQITLSEVASVSPLNIGVFSRTPLGYRCVWLLVGFDQMAMKVFQAGYYGLISRQTRDALLSNGGHWVRQVFGVVQQYQSVAVTREDIRRETPAGLEAIARFGRPAEDVMTGAARSAFSPPLRQPATGTKGGAA